MLSKFEKKFITNKTYGKNFFKGDVNDMKKLFISICYELELSEDENYNKQNEYCYIIQPRASVDTYSNVYKIGRTTNFLKRYRQYLKVVLLNVFYVLIIVKK